MNLGAEDTDGNATDVTYSLFGEDAFAFNIDADSGADILVGGFGQDKLKGGRGNDLLIGGSLDRDFNDVSLVEEMDTLLASWADGQMATLAEVEFYLGPIIDDEEKDDLKGEEDDDLLLAGLFDKLKD